MIYRTPKISPIAHPRKRESPQQTTDAMPKQSLTGSPWLVDLLLIRGGRTWLPQGWRCSIHSYTRGSTIGLLLAAAATTQRYSLSLVVQHTLADVGSVSALIKHQKQ